MLRRLFQKKVPLGTINDSLARLQAADTAYQRETEIAQLRDLLAVHHDAAGDAAQRGLIAMEDRLSARFSGLVQTQLGVTNDMISDINAGIGGLQRQLGDMFSEIGERLKNHDSELQGLRQGQRDIVTHVDTQIGGVVQQQTLQAEQIREISRLMEEQRTTYEARIAELEAYQSAISADERARRIAQIDALEGRMRALEEKPPLS